MKLRNKSNGEILEIKLTQTNCECLAEHEVETIYGEKLSLTTLNKYYEDYQPKQPLIKDEKIRKAVRAWAEMNDIRFIHMCSRTRKENARIVGQNALGRTFTMEIDNEYEIRVSFKDYKESYTLAELCGEEE